MCPNKISIALHIIFHKSLRQYKYPTDWKLFLLSSDRMLSFISCVRKIMERIVYKHVYNHLQRNKLINEYQSGFLPKHSTVYKLLKIYKCIVNYMEKKETNCFVFCGFSQAYGKIWHKGLLHTIQDYGMTGNLFSNYLHGHGQKVVMKTSLQHIVK